MEQRDAQLIDRYERHNAGEDNAVVDDGLNVEVRKVTMMLHVSLAVIGALVGVIVLAWMRWAYLITLLAKMYIVSGNVH